MTSSSRPFDELSIISDDIDSTISDTSSLDGSSSASSASASTASTPQHTMTPSLTEMSHSLPTNQQRGVRSGSLSTSSSAHNLLEASGAFLDLAVVNGTDPSGGVFSDYFAESTTTTTNGVVGQAHLTHSQTTGQISIHQQQHHHHPHPHHHHLQYASHHQHPPPASPTDWPRSGTNAIPIHGGHRSSNAGSNQQFRQRAGSHAMPSSLLPPPSSSPTSAYLTGQMSTSPPVTIITPGSAQSFSQLHHVASSGRQHHLSGQTITPSVAIGKPPSPNLPPRSWSLIDTQAGKPRQNSLSSSPVTSLAGTASTATGELGSSWNGLSGVTHIQLPADLPSAAREVRSRSHSFVAPASSSLTSHTAAKMNNPLKTFLTAKELPHQAKTQVGRVLEAAKELERTIDEYKTLLSKLWTRRRQVLGTLATSIARLQSCMQVAKLEVLQELVTTQSDLFDKEESMLRSACILLKEKQAAMKAGMEEMNEVIETLAQIILTSSLHGQHDSRAISHQCAPYLAAFPPADLMASLVSGQTAKQFAMAHPLLAQPAAEHRALNARLEVCKTRYLAVSKQTEVEELIPRPTRFKRVLAAMIAAQTKRQVAASAPSPSATPPPPSSSDSSAAPASKPIPPLLDHAPARDIELDFARLLLDERSKEGRACSQLLQQIDTLLAKKDSPSKTASTANSLNTESFSHPLNALTQSSNGGLSKSASSSSLVVVESSDINSARASPANGVTASTATMTTAPSSLPPSSSSSNLASGVTSLPSSPQDLSPLDIHQQCYDLLSSFLHRLEASLYKELALTAAQRPPLRLLIQRTLFPRLWKSLLQLGYEREDIYSLPTLPDNLAPDEDEVQEGNEMLFRESVLTKQLKWLKQVSPIELGVPAMFLKPTATTSAPLIQPTTATPRSSLISTSNSLPTSTPRAPPSYKPPPTPPIVSTWQPKPYREVMDLFEEIGQLSAPVDMISCLLSASKEIYVSARKITDQALLERKARGETINPNKQEALGADSFFPLFLYILIQSSVPQWLHRLKLMQKYALSEEECMAEPAYYLTTLEAALLFIQQATPNNINPNKMPAPTTNSPKQRKLSAEGHLTTPIHPKTTKLDSTPQKAVPSSSDSLLEDASSTPMTSHSRVIPLASTHSISSTHSTIIPVSSSVATTSSESSVSVPESDSFVASPTPSSISPAANSVTNSSMIDSTHPKESNGRDVSTTQPAASTIKNSLPSIPAPIIIHDEPPPIEVARSHPLFSRPLGGAPVPYSPEMKFEANDL